MPASYSRWLRSPFTLPRHPPYFLIGGQELARVGKQRCNPRITGFIKVVENTSFCFAAAGSYLPLATLLEEQLCGKR